MPLEQVDLSLLNPEPLRPGDVAHFSADFLPPFFTRPFTYTIEFDDGTPPVDGVSSSVPFLFDHSFAEIGDYTVTFSAWNCPSTVPVTSHPAGQRDHLHCRAGSQPPGPGWIRRSWDAGHLYVYPHQHRRTARCLQCDPGGWGLARQLAGFHWTAGGRREHRCAGCSDRRSGCCCRRGGCRLCCISPPLIRVLRRCRLR